MSNVKNEESDWLMHLRVIEETRGFGRGWGHDVYQGGRGRGNFFKEKVYTYCGKNGHTIDIYVFECMVIHPIGVSIEEYENNYCLRPTKRSNKKKWSIKIDQTS